MRCTIWYHLHNLKNVKNIHGEVLILVKLQASASFQCLYCYLWTYFAPCSSVSIVNFEQVIADWEVFRKALKFWSLKKSGTSYKKKCLYTDNRGKITGAKYKNQAKVDRTNFGTGPRDFGICFSVIFSCYEKSLEGILGTRLCFQPASWFSLYFLVF